MITIRHAGRADLDAVLAGYEWLLAPPGSVPAGYDADSARGRLVEAIESDRAAVIVADRGGAIAGFATVYLTYPSVRFGQRAWLEDLAVDPERRSAGIGARLLAAAREWAADQGVDLLGLESGDARTDAHRFYERERPDSSSRSFAWRLP